MTGTYRFAVVAALCGLIGFSVGCSNSGSDSASSPPETGQAADDPQSGEEQKPADDDESQPTPTEKVSLEIASWEEVEQRVAEHAGKIVVLDLWSTSCQPCLREFPHLVALHNKYPDDVVCMSVSTDYAGIKSKPPEFYRERVTEFLTGQGATFENYLCSVESDELFPKLELASIPAVMVFGTDGQLVNRFDNDDGKYGDEFTYADHVVPLIETLLKGSSVVTPGDQ
jgi:thiol-disulfide isomerase/thioredoxin